MSAHPLRHVAERIALLAPMVFLVACAGPTSPGAVSVPTTTPPTAVSTTDAVTTVPPTIVASTAATTTVPLPPAPTTVAPTTTPAPTVPADQPLSSPPVTDWTTIADSIGPLAMPADCPLPLGSPGLLPNADRAYRGGVHQGIDFVCMEWGHVATTPLPGHVVLALHGYQEPTIEQRNALLDEAKSLGFTPPSTLQFLFGRFVVVDHGIVPGVGHVVTIYAHLAEIDPTVQPGAALAAGSRIGLIGNSGTETAVTQGTRPQSIHLHWELHVNGVPFATGLDESATDEVSARLFDRHAG